MLQRKTRVDRQTDRQTETERDLGEMGTASEREGTGGDVIFKIYFLFFIFYVFYIIFNWGEMGGGCLLSFININCPEPTIIRDIKPKTRSLCPLFSRVFHVNFTCFTIPYWSIRHWPEKPGTICQSGAELLYVSYKTAPLLVNILRLWWPLMEDAWLPKWTPCLRENKNSKKGTFFAQTLAFWTSGGGWKGCGAKWRRKPVPTERSRW